MSWALGSWQDFLKKKACRYILQHYLGQFLKQKLSLDQLSLDLYKGTGEITDLELDVQAINDDLSSIGVPVQLVDGFVESISVSIPWSTLIQKSTHLEVTGLQLTLQPTEREDNGMMAGEMFTSMQSSMTTSLQLAKECLESESKNPQKPDPIEGVQKFALMIDSVLSKIRVTLIDTVIRLEHHPEDSPKGVALEIKIKRFEYFDDMATVDDSSVDATFEPAAISQKNLHIEGVQILFDEMTSRKSPSRSRSSSEGSSPQMFMSARSSSFISSSHDKTTEQDTPSLESNPIQIAVLTGKQEIKLKTKQSDALYGPKLEIMCHFGGLHILLSPKQLHGLLELVSGLSSPGTEHRSLSHGSSMRNKPMDHVDYQKIEVDLQQQLQSGRIHSNNLAQMHDYSLHGDDEQFFSLATGQAGDMESSYSSNYSTSTNRSTSTTSTNTRGSNRANKDPFSTAKYHDDPLAEISHYSVRVAFFSVTLLHNNLSQNSTNTDTSYMDVAVQYFQRVGSVTAAGVSNLKEVRKHFTNLVTYDHFRLLGRPLTVECNQKSASKQISTTLNVTFGVGELVETLYRKRNLTGPPTPEYSEIFTFHQDGSEVKKSAMYSSMQGGKPCFSMQVKSIAWNKGASRHGHLPQSDINIALGELHTELDVTLIDRITNLTTPEKIVTSSPLARGSMYHTAGPYCSLTQTLEDGSSSPDHKFTIEVSSPLVKLNIRFPIPDLRQESHVDKSWYERNLRDDVLCIHLTNGMVRTTFIQEVEEIQISSSDIHGYYKYSKSDPDDGLHFAHVSNEGGIDGFNNPTVTVKFCTTTPSVLDEDIYMDDTIPTDSLNGACQFAKAEPSPFSCRRYMQDSEQDSPNPDEKTEQMVLPADREEFNEFVQKSVNNTKMVIEIVLPKVCAFLPNKDFFEKLYNRLNNDMLLWEPIAPSPVTVKHDQPYSMVNTVDLNVYNQLLHTDEHFEMAKSGIQFDSDSDTDTDSINHYSIHDSRYTSRKHSPRQQQSKMCLNLNIGKGRLTAFTPYRDTGGTLLDDKHGEVMMKVNDFSLFTVSAHNRDPNIQYVSILGNRVDLYHVACLNNVPEYNPVIDCSVINNPVPAHLHGNHIIYRSEPGVLVNSHDGIGAGTDTQDMVAVALKIKLDKLTSKRDLTADDEIVKEFLVSVGLRGATMRHKMVPSNQSVFVQMMEFLDVKDYPILGYIDPKVLTELHVHLWTCAIDYRPLYLPMRAVILADSFSISSNIVAESSISLLRFVLDDGALFISKKTSSSAVNLRKDYVCVADIQRLELLLRSNTGNAPHYPKTDLRVSSNLVNIRTCADSCEALIELIKYIASDGDLNAPDKPVTERQSEVETDLTSMTEESEVGSHDNQSLLSESSIDHIHNLMSEAMLESSASSNVSSRQASPETSATEIKQTEVFFVANSSGGLDGAGPSSLEPIVITQTVDSVTSSMMSGGGAEAFADDDDDDDNSDDFCMIDDAAWGRSPKDGEPDIRVFTTSPVEIKDNHFSRPIGRTDLLKAPDNFPLAECRYTLKELTVVWYIYGGSDFSNCDSSSAQTRDRINTDMSRDSMTVSYHKGSPSDRWSGHAGGREVPLIPRETLQTKGGPGRDHCRCMELQLSKARFQHEEYPQTTEQASRQVLLISDIEIRDRIKSSKMNKFLYQYSSESMPRQTYANMVHVKLVHSRLNTSVGEEECAMKVSLQPIRLNVDQDTLFFLKTFFMDLFGAEDQVTTSQEGATHPTPHSNISPPAPVMTVVKTEHTETTADPQDLLMQFDELTNDLQASLRGSFGSTKQGSNPDSMRGSMSSTGTITSDTSRPAQPVFFKSFVFSPDVPIMLDYHGKFDREHGALAGLGGLVSLNSSELRLKRLAYKQGLLGADKVVSYCADAWLTDIKVNQLPTILGGFGPMHAFVQLAHGVKDLFWLPVEQYRKDGRIIRGIQRGATSFSMSTAMSVLELTNRVVQSVQWCAERTFDIVSPEPRRRGFYPRQPSDIREGVSNAYIVLREGISDTATAFVDATSKEHESKGMLGLTGAVIRQIPPTMLQPLILVPEAASNVIGGLRSQLKPDVKKEDEDKWKEEIID